MKRFLQSFFLSIKISPLKGHPSQNIIFILIPKLKSDWSTIKAYTPTPPGPQKKTFILIRSNVLNNSFNLITLIKTN